MSINFMEHLKDLIEAEPFCVCPAHFVYDMC